MYYQKWETPEVWCEERAHVAKLGNSEIENGNEFNKVIEGDPDVNMMFEAGRERESVGIKEVNPELGDASWCMIGQELDQWANQRYI